jgi:prepilin-type N-terminal cleavage/methylation domain-containing protein
MIKDMNPSAPQSSACSGFTLLEVIVALALVSTAVVVAFQLFASGSRAIAVSEGYANAVAGAEAVMREVLTGDNFPDTSVSSGAQGAYVYDISVSKAFEDRTQTVEAALYQVRVTVYWKEGARNKSFSLYTVKVADKKI